MIIGYTAGVFDLFHIGHLNLLRNAASMCDKLIVGVTTDELMLEYKKKKALIPYSERAEIVRAIDCVDAVIPQESMDKVSILNKLKFDIMFVGDDWYDTCKWKQIEEEFKKYSVGVVYFPYTKAISSTLLNKALKDLRK